MNVIATKTSFYENSGTHLRFVETTDTHKCKTHDCNCTKTVYEKPKTRLLSVQNNINVELSKEKYNVTVSLETGNFVIRWEDKHAYFNMLYRDHYKAWAEKGIRIEMYKQGWSSVDYLFATMFLGQHINISTLMNGHSPSKVINLAEIGRDDIWMHDCNWGKEAMGIMEDYDESNNWFRVIKTASNMTDMIVHKFRPESEYSIYEMKEYVSNESKLEPAINFCVDFFISIIENLENTEMYKLATSLRDNVKGV